MPAADFEQQYAPLIAYMRDVGLPLPPQYKGKFNRQDLVTAIGFAAFARQDGKAAVEAALARAADDRLGAVLAALRAVVLARIDELVGEIMGGQADQPGPPVACARGCSSCCHQNVEVTIPEAILAADALSDPADPRRAALLDIAPQIKGLQHLERMATGLPCPFLVDDACSIYAVRPIVCRTVLSPDRRRCEAALRNTIAGSGDRRFSTYARPQLYGFAFVSAAQGIWKDLGLQFDRVDLVQTVAAILRDPDLVPRWAAGEHVFQAAGKPEASSIP